MIFISKQWKDKIFIVISIDIFNFLVVLIWVLGMCLFVKVSEFRLGRFDPP